MSFWWKATVDQLEKGQCSGCELCASACPADAIAMKMDSEGFRYPRVDHARCIACGACVRGCAMLAYEKPLCEVRKAYACRNVDEEVRGASTSGGVYTPFAERVLDEGGVVYGVRFADDWSVTFDRAETAEDAMRFRLSKYPQASVRRIYEKAGEDLRDGRKVLFTGSPCQVAALKKYIGREHELLYTLDFICLGVASPGVWEWYLDHAHDRGAIAAINFKSKVCGWKDWRVLFDEDGKKTWETNRENGYMHDFCAGINVRPSCFACPFKGVDHASDLTVSDCWGLGETLKMNDDKGLSALLIHTRKGQRLFEKINGSLMFEEHDADRLMDGNRAAFGCLYRNAGRDAFFKEERWKQWKWDGKEYR